MNLYEGGFARLQRHGHFIECRAKLLHFGWTLQLTYMYVEIAFAQLTSRIHQHPNGTHNKAVTYDSCRRENQHKNNTQSQQVLHKRLIGFGISNFRRDANRYMCGIRPTIQGRVPIKTEYLI